jgi:hypothetical protein
MKTRFIGLSLAAAAGLLVTGMWTRASVAPMSREALASGFDSGIRNLVIEWDPNDTRPDAERRRALFDFIYQTYRSSAWIPQSLFDRNLVTQAVVGDVETIIGEKVGLVLWRDNKLVPAFGMAPNVDSQQLLRLAAAGERSRQERHASMDRQLPGLSHGGNRRRGVLRRGHQSVR